MPLKGFKHSEETKIKMKNSHIGLLHTEKEKEKIRLATVEWYKNNVIPVERIEKTRQSLKGKSSSMKGKHHTEETKERLRNIAMGRPSPRKGVKLSDETKAKLSKAKKVFLLGIKEGLLLKKQEEKYLMQE